METGKIARMLLSVLLIGGFLIFFFLVYTQKIKLPFNLPFLGGPGSSGPITLTYWGLWEPPEVLEPLIEEYQKEHPDVTINYEMRDPKNHFQTVSSRLKSELAPDIIRVHATWVPFLYPNLSSVPQAVMENQTYEQTFYPVTKETLFFNNKYFGIPLEIDGLALVYNEDLFKKAGLSGPPPTWDVFRDYVRRLTIKDDENNIVQSGAALGFAKNVDFFSDILGLMFAQNGVEFQDQNGKVTFSQSISPDGRNLAAEALTFYSLFAKSEKSWDPTWENSTAAFANGKVVMILIPSHKILEVLGRNPKINLKVAPAPQLPSNDPANPKIINWASYWVEVVPKNSAHPQAAWEFLKFLSEKEALTDFYKTAMQIRAFGEPYPRQDLAQSLGSDQFTKNYVQQGPSYETWYFADETHDALLNDKIVQILLIMVENVAAGKDTVGELNTAADQIQTILTDLTR